MKKTYAILGLGLAAGIAAYTICHAIRQKDASNANSADELNDNNNLTVETPVVDSNITTAENHTSFVKHTVASDIVARHEEATQIINDALDAIYGRTVESEKNPDELDQIAKELDNLLQEA